MAPMYVVHQEKPGCRLVCRERRLVGIVIAKALYKWSDKD